MLDSDIKNTEYAYTYPLKNKPTMLRDIITI